MGSHVVLATRLCPWIVRTVVRCAPLTLVLGPTAGVGISLMRDASRPSGRNRFCSCPSNWIADRFLYSVDLQTVDPLKHVAVHLALGKLAERLFSGNTLCGEK